jgi:hypothetical protein
MNPTRQNIWQVAGWYGLICDMVTGYETSEMRWRQVDLAAIGAEIFSTAAAAISASGRPEYKHKPLNSLVLYFERGCSDSASLGDIGLDDTATERLAVSITKPERVDEHDYSGKDKDIFLFPSFSDSMKNIIKQQIEIAGSKVVGEETDPSYYRVPACAVTTSYAMTHAKKRLVVDTNVYLPLPSVLIPQGCQFASAVVEHLRTKIYRTYPGHMPKQEGAFAAAQGGMTHRVGIGFGMRPPVNGHESKAWLEKYANWLRQSIEEMTFGPEEPKSAADFRGIGDSAMNDGILLIKTLDAIQRAKE